MFDKPEEPAPTERRQRVGLRVDVSGNKLEFPLMCACCCGPAEVSLVAVTSRTTGTRVVKVQEQAWSFPYCTACLVHFRASKRSVSNWSIVMLFGLLLVMAVSIPSAFCAASILVFFVWSGTYFWRKHTLKLEAEAMCSSLCVGAETAVSYLGWDGATHSFIIDNEEFALEFMRANRKKLVNTDYAIVPLLDAPRRPVETITRTAEKG